MFTVAQLRPAVFGTEGDPGTSFAADPSHSFRALGSQRFAIPSLELGIPFVRNVCVRCVLSGLPFLYVFGRVCSYA